MYIELSTNKRMKKDKRNWNSKETSWYEVRDSRDCL